MFRHVVHVAASHPALLVRARHDLCGPADRAVCDGAPALAIAHSGVLRWCSRLSILATALRERRSPWRETAALMVAARAMLLALHFLGCGSPRFATRPSRGSVLLVNLRPVIVWAIAARWLGEHPGKTERWGIGVAVAGAALIGLVDARGSVGALSGDGLALAAAIAAAGYSVIGRRVRRTVGVWTYVSTVYAVAATALGIAALVSGTRLTGFGERDWAVFAGLAVGPMLIGHTGLNYSLKHFRATTVSVAGLGEPVGATLLAWLLPAIHEVPSLQALAGGVLVLVGIGLALGAGEAVPQAIEPESLGAG